MASRLAEPLPKFKDKTDPTVDIFLEGHKHESAWVVTTIKQKLRYFIYIGALLYLLFPNEEDRPGADRLIRLFKSAERPNPAERILF